MNLCYEINRQRMPIVVAVWVGKKPVVSTRCTSFGVVSNSFPAAIGLNFSGAARESVNGKRSQISAEKSTTNKTTGCKIRGRLPEKMPVRRPVFLERSMNTSPQAGMQNMRSETFALPKDVNNNAGKPAAVGNGVVEVRKRRKAARKLMRKAQEKVVAADVQKPAQKPVEGPKFIPILSAKTVRKNIYQKRVAADKICAEKEYKGKMKAEPRYVHTEHFGTAALKIGSRNRRVNKGALKRIVAQNSDYVKPARNRRVNKGALKRIVAQNSDCVKPVEDLDGVKPVGVGDCARKTRKVTLGEFMDNVTDASGTVRLKVYMPQPDQQKQKVTKRRKAKKAKT